MDNWRNEFKYLLDRKALSRAELSSLFEQIKSIIDRETELLQNSTLYHKNKKLQSQLTALQKIADFAFDIHTRDPVNVKNKWGVCGVKAEEKLCDMIEAQLPKE